ncbi:MAG TPA: PASTA domain-containing protein [Flavobacteriales bacterium]|nr:PASTA domain-containing protein [Flavobacteriales bacterium]
MWAFLKSRFFFFNLLIIAGLVLGLLWFIFKSLDDFTLHGQSIIVPDLKGFEVNDLDTFLTDRKLRYIIADSIYIPTEKKGVVIDQDPKPGLSVKENRRIYLIVNAIVTPKVKLPNLIDLSLRQVITTLETYGFVVGELEYVPDIARDAVIGQKVNGIEINTGDMVKKGATIDLIMGDGLSDEEIRVPLIVGLNQEEALMVLKTSSLNEGGVVYDKTVLTSTDSANAKIWRQHPEYGVSMINLGGNVDFWLSMDQGKVVLDSSFTDTIAPVNL